MKHPLVYKATMGIVYGLYTAAFFAGLWAAARILPCAVEPIEAALAVGLMFVFVDRAIVYIMKAAHLITGDAE